MADATFWGCNASEWVTKEDGESGGLYWINSWHETEAEAQAVIAGMASQENLQSSECSYVWYWHGAQDTNRYICYYPVAGYNPPTQGDQDEDGIPDEYDPYPQDSEPFSWQFIKGVRDPETGLFKAYCIRTDRGDNFCFGDMEYWQGCINALYVGCELEVFQEGDFDKEGGLITDYLLTLASEFTPPVTVAKFEDGERIVLPSSGIEQGVDYLGTETDSEALGKIVDNTSDIASNQQRIADYLKGIDQGIAGIQEGISNIDNGNINVEIGGYDGPTASDIANAIDANNKNNEDSVLSGAQSRLAAIEDPEFSDSIGPEDIPAEEDTITGVIQTFMEGNAVSQALQNSGVNLQNPACSLEVELPNYGTFELSLCEYESALEIFGNILLGIVGLVSVIMVIRG